MKDQLNPWKVVTIVLSGLFLMCYLTACNPVKQAQKQADNAEKQRAALAKLCAEQFPIKPEIKFTPGEVDTSGLWKWLNGLANLKDSDITKIAHFDSTYAAEKKFHFPANNTILLQIDSTGRWSGPLYNKLKDSLIRVLKRFVKPDTFRIKIPDTAALVGLKYDFKIALQKNNELQIENRNAKVTIAEWKGKARTRQWIIIAIIGIGVVGVIAKLNGGSILKLFKK